MRIGILGDIHSNLEALNAVVRAMRAEGVDHWLQVGDIVGYGPDPCACLDIVRELDAVVCMGNHDAAVVGLLETDYFNAYARMAIEWTRTQLRLRDLAYLRNLPISVIRRDVDYTVVHGSLYMPEQFGYVLTTVEAIESMRHQETMMCFVGHSHVPAIYVLSEDDPSIRAIAPPFELNTNGVSRVLVNVGSVGQPRDENRDAAYAIWDTETGELAIRRTPYDIQRVQEKIRAAGLPGVLADRLAIGV
jgi:diadenosine tetraphosphatase ApaH/serine/threonine PP2A family protein phosphatase